MTRYPRTRYSLTRYQKLTATTVVATLILITIGAVVRTTGSGLGCPDWPLCQGGLIPPAEKAAIIEYSHRTVAAIVGALVLSVAAVTLLRHRDDRTLAALAIASLPLLALQAWLGKITVERELPAEVVAAHLAMAMVLLAVLTLIAALAYLGPDRTRITALPQRRFVQLSAAVAAITFLVIVGGSYVVGANATAACDGWPGCPAAPIPFIDGIKEHHIQWLHRLTVLFGIGAVAIVALQAQVTEGLSERLRQGAVALVVLYGFQIVLGALNVWTGFSEAARVAHLAGSATVWTVAVLLVAAGSYEPGVRRDEAPQSMPDRAPSREPEAARA